MNENQVQLEQKNQESIGEIDRKTLVIHNNKLFMFIFHN